MQVIQFDLLELKSHELLADAVNIHRDEVEH